MKKDVMLPGSEKVMIQVILAHSVTETNNSLKISDCNPLTVYWEYKVVCTLYRDIIINIFWLFIVSATEWASITESFLFSSL